MTCNYCEALDNIEKIERLNWIIESLTEKAVKELDGKRYEVHLKEARQKRKDIFYELKLLHVANINLGKEIQKE